jgi:glucokinase
MTAAIHVIGADIGGTHCTAALVDLQQKKIVSSTIQRSTVDAGAAAAEIVEAWSGCILSARQNVDTRSICLAMPGPFDYEKGICLMKGQHKYESLYGLNVKELLADKLQVGPAEIFMDNDAACFLQGEVFAGTAAGHASDKVIGITLGTGLGSAVYGNGVATNADWWRMPFKDGMAEDYLSARWFLQRFETYTGTKLSGVKELAQLTATSEPARLVFHEFAIQLAQFLLEIIEQEKPRAIVIGGNISKANSLFSDLLRDRIAAQHPRIQIKWSVMGEEAPLLGAAGSWWLKPQKKSMFLKLP